MEVAWCRGFQAAKAYLDYNENAHKRHRLEVRRSVIGDLCDVWVAEGLVATSSKQRNTLEKMYPMKHRKIYEDGLAEGENVEQLANYAFGLFDQPVKCGKGPGRARQMFNEIWRFGH